MGQFLNKKKRKEKWLVLKMDKNKLNAKQTKSTTLVVITK